MNTNTINRFTVPRITALLAKACALTAALALGACGGGAVDSSVGEGTQTAQRSEVAGASPALGKPAALSVPSAQTIAQQEEGARLNAAELAEIAATGVLPKVFEGPLLSGAELVQRKASGERKSAASRAAVYRFYNLQTSAHFFTTSVTERNNVQATAPHMSYEGPAFYASSSVIISGLSPVHRFYNTRTGVHFYTISESERAHIAATLPQFTYEGIAYHASTLGGTGYTPLYRFFHTTRGFHFYTNSASERDNIIATLPQYSFEGVGYYVLDSEWQTPAVPHTGMTVSQCYQAGSNTLVDCSLNVAITLNADQDGHRRAIRPMSYSQIISGYFGTFPTIFPLYFPKTDCVRDDVTGLIWEGKTLTGTRAGSNTHTNYGDGRAGDATAYVNEVNALALCGFSDWRLPSVEELMGIVDHSPTTGPRIRSADFPNTAALNYWSSEAYVGLADHRWVVSFRGEGDDAFSTDRSTLVRLVRGPPWRGTRYLITSATYFSDGPNNAFIDRKTGLTWRRCLEGFIWTGSACIGGATTYNHQNALARANGIAGWRMPNIKELSSLVDRSRVAPAQDAVAYPGAGSGVNTWSSTPVPGTANAGYVDFSTGHTSGIARSSLMGVHLVLNNPLSL